MRKRLLVMAIALLGIAAGSAKPAFAGGGCPGNIVVGGWLACHATSGTDCHDCWYYCDDGQTYNWNVCLQ